MFNVDRSEKKWDEAFTFTQQVQNFDRIVEHEPRYIQDRPACFGMFNFRFFMDQNQQDRESEEYFSS
jgi:hypothetical protein